MHQKKFLIVVVGATAVGKTELCVDLAKYLNTEIISADSRQFYQEMRIGTAKPSDVEMKGVHHHFINNLSIESSYDVGRYEQDALIIIDQIFQKKDATILTGGSGLYINAICNGIDEMPEISSDIRRMFNELHEKKGINHLAEKLRLVDDEYYNQVDKKNPQRVIRALEVYQATGKPYSSFRKSTQVVRPFHMIKIGLHREREELYTRIDQRMDMMIDQGLFEEAESLYPHKLNNALQTVGYKEIFHFIDGMYDKKECIRLLKRNSRRYAKRQMTWFRKDKDITWFDPEDKKTIITHLKKYID